MAACSASWWPWLAGIRQDIQDNVLIWTLQNELNASLNASTMMTYQSGPNHCCGLCHEPDHDTANCVLLDLQSQPPQLPPTRSGVPMQGGPAGPEDSMLGDARQDLRVLELGSLLLPLLLISCATCKRRGHRARDCEETPADSPYKSSPVASPRSSRGQGSN